MKTLCALLSILTIAGCAHVNQAPSAKSPDGYYNNETKWQENNRHKQENCVLHIIQIAPPTATAEELDYNLQLCLLRNDVFIYNELMSRNQNLVKDTVRGEL